MLGAFFRAVFSITPFIKEVFIHSDEDKRRWLGRMVIIVIITLFGGYLVVDYLVDNHRQVVEENKRLHQQLENYRLKIASCTSTTNNLSESSLKDKSNYQTLLEQYRESVRRANRLEQENNQCKISLESARHTMRPEPTGQKTKTKNTNRLKGLDND